MKLDYKPHPAQKKIHRALQPYLSGNVVMVVAGRRFGKTILGIIEIIKRALSMPGSRIWYIAFTKQQAYDVAWRLMLYPRVDKDGKLHPPFLPDTYIKKQRDDRHYIELTNGSLIEFKGVQDELFMLGAYLHFVVFDEFPAIPATVWFDIVRPMLIDFRGDALFTGTIPDPKVHYITKDFIDMYEEKLFSANGKKTAFNFTSFDNPYTNHKEIRAQIADLEKKGRAQEAKRLYYGKYTREYGLVFPTFNYEKHTVIPRDIPGNWLKVNAVDPHPQKPICGLWAAIDPRNHLWFYREKEFSDSVKKVRTVYETGHDIIEIENDAKERVKARLIDPTFAKIDQNVLGQKSVKRLFEECGLMFREASRDFNTFFHLFTDRLAEEPEPTIHILRTLPNLIRQISNYSWESWASLRARQEKGEKDRPKKVDDDFVDCAKYIINSNIRYVDPSAIKRFQSKLKQRWASGQIS